MGLARSWHLLNRRQCLQPRSTRFGWRQCRLQRFTLFWHLPVQSCRSGPRSCQLDWHGRYRCLHYWSAWRELRPRACVDGGVGRGAGGLAGSAPSEEVSPHPLPPQRGDGVRRAGAHALCAPVLRLACLLVCPHPLCSPLPQAGEGDYGVRKRSFRPR